MKITVKNSDKNEKSPEKKKIKKTDLPRLDDFLLNLQTNNYSSETIYNYERDLEVFADFLGDAEIPFDHVSKDTLLRYKAYLISRDRETPRRAKTKRQLASFSINRMLSALRSYFSYLIEIDIPIPVPLESVKLVKTERKHPHIAELTDYIKLIESPSTLERNPMVALRNRTMLETLFSTGMRISELLNLKKAQIDKTGKIFILGKGKKERFVYLTPRAVQFVNDYLEKRGIDEFQYLFIPLRGTHYKEKEKKISPNYLQAKIKWYREALDIPIPISAHSLRHAFATYLAEKGANPAAIQILLGHESLETTTRYVQASDKYAEETHHKFHPLSRSPEEKKKEKAD